MPNGSQTDHDNKVAHADVGITHAAHGELRRIVANGVFPGGALRHFAQLIVIHRVNDHRFLQRCVAADAVADLVFRDVSTAFDNLANNHIAQLELTEFDPAGRTLFARGKHLPLRVELFVNKRACRAEIHHFGTVFRRAKAGANFHFMDGNRTIFIFHQRRYTRRCRN